MWLSGVPISWEYGKQKPNLVLVVVLILESEGDHFSS